MYVKIMGRENAADDDSRKMFAVHAHVASAEFVRKDGKAVVEVLFDDDSTERFDVPGNAYVLNDNGDTIASFGAHRLPAAA